jgi:hypothetical protein
LLLWDTADEQEQNVCAHLILQSISTRHVLDQAYDILQSILRYLVFDVLPVEEFIVLSNEEHLDFAFRIRPFLK